MKVNNKVKPIYAVAILWLLGTWVLPMTGKGWFIFLIIATFAILKKGKRRNSSAEDEDEDEYAHRARASYERRRSNAGKAGSKFTAEVKLETGRAAAEAEAIKAQARAEAARYKAEARAEAAKLREQARAAADADKVATAQRNARAEEEAAKRDKLAREEEEARLRNEANANKNRRPRTGDAQIDRMLDDEEKAIAELKRLDDAIPDEKLSAQIVHLEEVTSKIVNFIVEHPDKKNQVRKFFTYYLPTSIKFLNAYDRMDEVGISGENIDGTKGNIEKMMDTLLIAFDKQLDALYSDVALDINSDIKVMESMLAQEGLTGDSRPFL